MQQLSLFELLEPPAPRRRSATAPVIIRAYGGTKNLEQWDTGHAPFELSVRGIDCTVTNNWDASTIVIAGPGAMFWSETGFRSFGRGFTDPDQIAAWIEDYISAPPGKDGAGGLGGKLVRWWPGYALEWRAGTGFILRYGRDRGALWAQWGPERHAAIWAKKAEDFTANLRRMQAEGIDPNDLGPPQGWKGKWPRWTHDDTLDDV